MGGKNKYINIFGSVTEPFNWGASCRTDYTGPPNCAPAVELVNGQPPYGQPSVTSPPCTRQRKPHIEDQRPCMPSQPIRPPAQVPVTNRKAPLNYCDFIACHS